MRIWALALLILACAHAQQLEFLNQQAAGKVARDPQGNWIFAESVNGDIHIRKLSPDLARTAFDITIGGSGRDLVSALQVDADGNAYLTGVTESTDFPTTPNALSSSLGASYFLKVDSAGKVATSTYLQTVGGYVQAADFVAASNGDWIIAASGSGQGTLLLLRLNHDGTVARDQRWVDAGTTPRVAAIRSDAAGNLFVAGSTSADNFPVTPGAFGQKRLSGTCLGFGFFAPPYPCSTGFVMKFDGGDLHTIAATYLGGSHAANITGVAIDSAGNPYVTGTVARYTPATPEVFPVTPGAFQTSFTGSGSVPFVTKLTPDLTAIAYSTYLGGSVSETATSIAVDDAGQAIVSGVTTSRDFPTTGVFGVSCGPQDPNFPGAGFLTRLSADGSAVDSSALLDSAATIQFMEGGDAVATDLSDLLRVHMVSTGPVAACTVNGGNFRREGFLAPGQLVTVMGGPFPPQVRLLFDGIPAPVLYAGATQINAVVPRGVAGQTSTVMEIDVDGARSNARQFVMRGANPTVKIWIAPDGSVDNRGNLLADVALSDGTPNTEVNPAHSGEVVTIFTTGIDVTQPIAMRLNYTDAPVLRVSERPGTFGAVVGLDVQVPGPVGGMYVISIQNGGNATALNAGFIWTQ